MFDPSKLNYAALEESAKFKRSDFTPQQLETAGLNGAIRGEKIARILLLILAGFTIMLLVINISASIRNNSPLNLPYILIQTVWMTVIIIMAMIVPKWYLNSKLKLLKFSIDNGLNYDARTRKPLSEQIMFRIGHSQKINDVISWPQSGNQLARFSYTVGRGKNQQTYNLNYLALKLPRRLPHLFLNSRQNTINADIGNYNVEKLKLEGDFAKTFTLYAPPQYRVDALQVFTPDVMAALIDHGARYDYEILDDRLYVYSSNFALNKKELLQSFLESTARLEAEFTHQAKNYKDTAAGTFAENTVADSGARLQKKRWTTQAWLAIAIGAFVALMIGSFIYRIIKGFSSI